MLEPVARKLIRKWVTSSPWVSQKDVEELLQDSSLSCSYFVFWELLGKKEKILVGKSIEVYFWLAGYGFIS